MESTLVSALEALLNDGRRVLMDAHGIYLASHCVENGSAKVRIPRLILLLNSVAYRKGLGHGIVAEGVLYQVEYLF